MRKNNHKLLKGLFNVFLLFTLISSPAFAKPTSYIADDERNVVSFTSDAPIELIVGRTSDAKGEIVIDDSLDLKKLTPKVGFEVDLASIDTGIPLRNQHMRDNFLETKKYPKAIFKVKNLDLKTGAKLIDGKTIKLNATGDFTVHGVTVKKDVPIKVTYFKESDFTHTRFKNGDVDRKSVV